MYSTPPMARPPATGAGAGREAEPATARMAQLSLSEWRTRRSPHALPSMRRMARKRAQQRWSALLTANTSRLTREMRAALGEHWDDFVARATRYKAGFLGAFDPPSALLRCVGSRRGAPCPHGFVVDLTSESARHALEKLELDHEHDVQVTCDLWRRQLSDCPLSWDDGIQDPELLCHLLFGVRPNAKHRAALRFRCTRCHKRHLPHYDNLRAAL